MALTMDDRDGKIWYNGSLVDWREAKTHVLTHTLHYGMGVFEGVRAYETAQGPAIFRLQDHTDRFFDSAKIVGIKLPFDKEAINRAHLEVVRANGLKSCYFRPMAFYGSGKLGIAPKADDVQVIVAAWAWGAYLGEDAIKHGIRCKISSFSRHHPNITMIKAKANGNYMNSIMANSEAQQSGFDEAILLDSQGYVAEGAGENIFTVHRGRLFTPALDVALDGITRRTVIEIARDMGLEVVEKTHHPRRTLYCRRSILHRHRRRNHADTRKFDNRPVGSGSRGEITARLQQRFFDIVAGRDAEYAHLLTYVV